MILAELLGPDGSPVSRVRLDGPVAIGTDRACTLALAHPSVAPRHVEVEERPDGSLRLRHLPPEGETRVESLVVSGEAEVMAPAVVHVGEVAVRLSIVPAEGEETAAAAAPTPKSRPFGALAAWGLFLGTMILVVGEEYLTTYKEEAWREALFMGVGITLLILLWAGSWALGNRLFGHRRTFLTHLGWFSLWILVVTPVGFLTGGLYQAVHTGVFRVLSVGVNAALTAWLLYLHIRVASRWRPLANALVACAVVVGFGSLAFIPLDTSAQRPVKDALSKVAPLPAALYVTRPAESLSDRADKLFTELDGLEAKRSVAPAP